MAVTGPGNVAPVDIVNMALDGIAARATVTSINPSDGTVAGNVATRQYETRIQALMRSAHWNCCKCEATLTLLAAAVGTPENPDGSEYPTPGFQEWLYEYALPSPVSPATTPMKFLKARQILPLFQTVPGGGVPIMTGGAALPQWGLAPLVIPFAIANDTVTVSGTPTNQTVLCTNMSGAVLVYTGRVPEDQFDPMFLEAAISVMSGWLCMPVNGDKQLAAMATMRAKEIILGARVADGNEGPQSSDHIPDWISARRGGGGMGSTWLPPAYDSIVFWDGTGV